MRIVLLTALTKPSMAHFLALVITMAKKLRTYLRYENIGCQVKLKSSEKVLKQKLCNTDLIMNGLYLYSTHCYFTILNLFQNCQEFIGTTRKIEIL